MSCTVCTCAIIVVLCRVNSSGMFLKLCVLCSDIVLKIVNCDKKYHVSFIDRNINTHMFVILALQGNSTDLCVTVAK